MNYIVKEFLNTRVIKTFLGIITSKWAESSTSYISPLYGSSKSFLINGLFSRENQIVLLLPDSKAVDEFKVELTVLGLSDSLLILNEYRAENTRKIFR